MRRALLLVSVAIFVLSTVCFAKEIKIHGFVTTVNSPTNFEIDDYKITRDLSLVLDIEKDTSDEAAATFNPEDIRVGTELEIKGDYNDSTGELKAKSIKVFLDDTRKINRMALLEKAPQLEKTDNGAWHGFVFADGQRVAITEQTVVTLKPNSSERKEAKAEKSNQEQTSKLTSIGDLNLDTFIHYEGFRQADGSVLASKAEFQHAELESGEAKIWRQLTPKVKEADYSAFKAGELKLGDGKYKLVPSKEAQAYVSTLGERLIPQHQKDLPPGSPLKIPFTFYLVQDKSFNAAAYPNGVLIVHSGVFDVLENEAQLAFVMSHEITHAIEKHTWHQQQYHKGALTALRIGGALGGAFGGSAISNMANLIEAGIRNGYARSLENQADRVGLEWMLASGYDIREAPRSWKAYSKKFGDRPTNFFWDNHDNNTTRRSYLMSELRNNYSDLDYSVLKKDSDDFHRIGQQVQDAERGKKQIKVKVAQTKSANGMKN